MCGKMMNSQNRLDNLSRNISGHTLGISFSQLLQHKKSDMRNKLLDVLLTHYLALVEASLEPKGTTSGDGTHTDWSLPLLTRARKMVLWKILDIVFPGMDLPGLTTLNPLSVQLPMFRSTSLKT